MGLERTRKALAGLRCAPLILGAQDGPELDLEAFQYLLDGLHSLALSVDGLKEIELNPVSVIGGKPMILDAAVVTDGPSPARA
jgi:hypothetical protein